MIPYSRQSINQQDIDAVIEVLQSDYLTQGPRVSLFEQAVADKVGAEHAITEQGHVAMFSPEHFGTRSQDLEEAWHDAGQFYWGTAEAWLQEKPVFSEGSVPVMLPRHRVQYIDTPEDWDRAEWLFKAMHAAQNTYASKESKNDAAN